MVSKLVGVAETERAGSASPRALGNGLTARGAKSEGTRLKGIAVYFARLRNSRVSKLKVLFRDRLLLVIQISKFIVTLAF